MPIPFLRCKYSALIGHILKAQLFCHGKKVTKLYDACFPPSSPPHPSPTQNVHILLSEFSSLKPRALLCSENPSELANTHPPTPSPRLIEPQSTFQASLPSFTHCEPPLFRHWRCRISSRVSSPQLSLCTVRVPWHLGLSPLPSPLSPSLATASSRASGLFKNTAAWPCPEPHCPFPT